MANSASFRIIELSDAKTRRRVTRLLWLMLILGSSLLLGIGGYMMLEGYSLQDALFMSVITISTVGYGEVQPLTEAGRVFTTFYIVINLGIFAYVVSVFTAYVFEGELNRIYRHYVSTRELRRMKDHIIVCGLGRNGIRACEELYESGRNFIVIDRNQDTLDHYPQAQNYSVIIGDAIYDEVLQRAGIDRAAGIITTLPSDADNVYITLTAREANEDIFIIARASEENSERKLYRAGADRVVMPDALGGIHMAQLITKPYVIEFLNLLNGIGSGTARMELEEFRYEEFSNEYKDRSIRDLDVRNRTGATVMGFKDDKQGFMFNPPPGTEIGPGDILIVLGTELAISQFRSTYTQPSGE